MHIVFLNPQGNFDKNDSYWTMHPDFGGQLVYVKEIAIEMAKIGHKVDIITRYIDDAQFPEFNQTIDFYEGIKNLRILRIKCGGSIFLNKELLWEHLEEWTENIITFYRKEGKMFDFMTGHYADGGFACAMIKSKLNIPYSFTGHSLGAQKFDKLNGNLSNYQILDEKYNFTKRIIAERIAINYSDIIFVSTTQEKDEQYTHKLYCENIEYHNPLEFIVASPGANTIIFAPYDSSQVNKDVIKKIDETINRDIDIKRRDLPFIISASRLDPKKNHIGLIKAFALNKEVQSLGNLLISVRGIDNALLSYENSSAEEKLILDEAMKIIKDNNLIGKVMFISISSQSELAQTYRYMAKKGSIFTLTALYEPFGLAPIEAMSTGLPAVVTKYGGPSEVLKENSEEFGVLIDAFDIADIAKGIIKAFNNYDFYQKQGMKRVITKYTWKATAQKYLEAIDSVLNSAIKSMNSYKAYIEYLENEEILLNYINRSSEV